MIPKPSRNRSRRLRKKLRIGEFKEWCFTFKFNTSFEAGQLDKFTDDLIDLVEANGLSLFSWSSAYIGTFETKGGSTFFAHISPSSCRGCSIYGCNPGQPVVEEHRKLFRDFIEQQIPGAVFTEFSELKDLNYSDED